MNEQQVAIASHIAHLITKRLEGVLTEPEWMELREWIHSNSEHHLLFEELSNPEQLAKALQTLQQYNTEAAIQRFLHRI